MTRHFRTITFIGSGDFAGCAVSSSYGPRGFGWSDLRAAMAQDLDLDPESLATQESYWGGEYGDADRCEIVTLDGKLIGAIDRALTADEFAFIAAMPRFGHPDTTDAERVTPALQHAAE